MMRKKLAALALAASLALCLPSFCALAAEPLSAPESRTALWSAPEAEDNDDLFSVFVAARLYGAASGGAAGAAGSRLTGGERAVYDALLPRIQAAADRGGSTVFTLPANGLPSFDLKAVMSALLSDCPYELYWFQRAGDESGAGGVEMTLSGGVCSFRFHVAQNYRQDGLLFMVRGDVSGVSAAREAVREVLAAAGNKSDYEKLTAYKDAVLALANRTGEAGSVEYGDPWQLIRALDGDPETSANCEGYARAFQYLCGMGGLEDAECYTVEGLTDGGGSLAPHMWNIVRVGSKYYLADLSNSDEGGPGASGGLFLAGAAPDESTDPVGCAVTLPGGSKITYYFDQRRAGAEGEEILLTPAEKDYIPG